MVLVSAVLLAQTHYLCCHNWTFLKVSESWNLSNYKIFQNNTNGSIFLSPCLCWHDLLPIMLFLCMSHSVIRFRNSRVTTFSNSFCLHFQREFFIYSYYYGTSIIKYFGNYLPNIGITTPYSANNNYLPKIPFVWYEWKAFFKSVPTMCHMQGIAI